MTKFARAAALWLLVILALAFGQQASQAAEQRFALVIGNDEYKAAKLATSANDAGLVADALQSAGFTVTGARNLDQATLRESFREFIGQVSAAGPDAVALVYLAGIGLQFNGENYFVPVDADIQRDVDVPLQAIRISDFTQPLASLPGRVKIVILDAARQNPFAGGNQPLAGGLALVEPMHSMAIAFNAAPGTVAPDEQGPYGAYATSLTEMIAAGGLGLDDLFARLRLRVSDLTQGAEIPWYASQIDGPFFMTELAAGAPPPPNVMPIADVRAKPIRDFPSVDDAYAAALDRDTIDGYEQFLAVYPKSPYSERIAGMLAVRREAIIWRRSVIADTPPGLLVVSAPLSERAPCLGCATAPGDARRGLRPAARFHLLRFRRAAAAAGRARLCRPAGHHICRAALRAAAAATAVLPAAAAARIRRFAAATAAARTLLPANPRPSCGAHFRAAAALGRTPRTITGSARRSAGGTGTARFATDRRDPCAAARPTDWSRITSGTGQPLDLDAASGATAYRTGRASAVAATTVERLRETGIAAAAKERSGADIGETWTAAAS